MSDSKQDSHSDNSSNKVLFGKPVKGGQLGKLSKKPPIVIVLFLLIVVIGAAAYGAGVKLKNNTTAQKGICTYGSGKESAIKASKGFTEKNDNVLRGAVESIKLLDGYAKDPNCNYAITLLYLRSGDIKSAKSQLLTLKSQTQNGEELQKLDDRMYSISELESQLQVQEQLKEQILKNMQINTFKNSER